MFNIVDYPPGLGECSFCKKHTCGTKEDGTQQWLHSPIELHVGNDLTIGYQCAKMVMDGFGLTVEVREKEVLLTPTNEQIGDYIRNAVNTLPPHTSVGAPLVIEDRDTMRIIKTNAIRAMDKPMLKEWFNDRQIPFVPQWGEERLREEALKHV